MVDLTALSAQVDTTVQTEGYAASLITTLASADDPAPVTALAAKLKASSDSLSAVIANASASGGAVGAAQYYR